MTSASPTALPIAGRLRLLALHLLGVVCAALFAGAAALAQPAEDAGAADPPGRVGSVSLLAGPVTMVDLATGSREEALLNWPVTGGWRIETGGDGRAEVRIGSTALRLDEETTVDIAFSGTTIIVTANIDAERKARFEQALSATNERFGAALKRLAE
jgi:hypothetical protein